jgi:hypothetical protein
MTDQNAVQVQAGDPEQLKAQLEALQAKREAIEAARLEREKPSLQEQVAIEQRRLTEDEKFDELSQQHGKLIEMVRPEDRPDVGAVIVKAPHLATYRRFQESGKADFKTFDALVRPCLLYPSKGEFDALCEQMPALHTLACNAVVRLAGHRGKDVESKQ